VEQLQIIYNGNMQRPFPNRQNRPFGCNGHVTGNGRGCWPKPTSTFYSGVGIFNWHYLSFPPQIMRFPRVPHELGRLISTAFILDLGYFGGLEYRSAPRVFCTSATSTFIQHSSLTPGAFCTCFYNHAQRLRLEKLLYLELSRSPNGFFKPVMDPGG
jgi:hypothetical protein